MIHDYMPYLVVAVVEAVIIIGLVEDCIMVRRERRKLDKELGAADWNYNNCCRRNAELAHDLTSYRERCKQLSMEYQATLEKLKVQAELTESYRTMAARYVNKSKD